jgi:hypothetical protein
MLYKPLDNGDLEYHGGGDSGAATSLVGISYGMKGVGANTSPANMSPIGERVPVAFCIMITGATASKNVCRIKSVMNYESVPLSNSLGLFSTEVSGSNPGLLAQAVNAAASLPWGEAWQGVAGIAGRLGQEAAQTAFSVAGNMAGAALLQTVRSSGWRTGNAQQRALQWTNDYSGGLGLD